MSHFPLLASYSASTAFAVDSADFDGTNDYMTRGAGLTGAANSSKFSMSFWTRIDGGNSTNRRIFAGYTTVGGGLATAQFRVQISSGNIFTFTGTISGATSGTQLMGSTIPRTAGSSWLHVLASWDLSSTTGQIYINDISDRQASPTLPNETTDFTSADWAIGGNADGSQKYNGCLAELWFMPGTSIDFSVEANRRKFIDSDGKPVDLGSDGSSPTGTAPLIYQHLDDAEVVANFATNRGTGGNLSITGTLATGSTSPSD